MKQPIAGVTHYRGWRIVFDGEFFDLLDGDTAYAPGLRTLAAAKAYVDAALFVDGGE